MTIYKLGKITSKGKNYIILESNNEGQIIYVSKPENFKTNIDLKIFIYRYKYEHLEALYGFQTFKERVLFEDLLTVPGIGPKTGIIILQSNIEHLIKLIAEGDFEKLAEIPGIGLKSSRQIIFEVQNKYKNIISNSKTNNGKRIYQPIEISSTLKTLGFNNQQIKYVIKRVKPSESIESIIEEAIRIISSEQKQISKT